MDWALALFAAFFSIESIEWDRDTCKEAGYQWDIVYESCYGPVEYHHEPVPSESPGCDCQPIEVVEIEVVEITFEHGDNCYTAGRSEAFYFFSADPIPMAEPSGPTCIHGRWYVPGEQDWLDFLLSHPFNYLNQEDEWELRQRTQEAQEVEEDC